jgi:imidazolonepropionase-like amidohydrolase
MIHPHSFAWTPHGSYRDPLLFYTLLGMSPMDVLLACTALGGELMGRPDELGKVREGYYADLLLVEGDVAGGDFGALEGGSGVRVVVIVSFFFFLQGEGCD